MRFILLLIALLVLPGCANIPINPRLRQDLNNQDGEIDELKNNQNGLMLDFIELQNDQKISAERLENLQQGLINQNNENSGVQIFQGDGGLIVGFGVLAILLVVISHYRSRAVKGEKTAEILALSIAEHDNIDLEDRVFINALSCKSEKDVYKVMVKGQSKAHGRRS